MIKVLVILFTITLIYFTIGAVFIKLIQKLWPNEVKDPLGVGDEDSSDKGDFYTAIGFWPIVLVSVISKKIYKCHIFDWFFNLGDKS